MKPDKTFFDSKKCFFTALVVCASLLLLAALPAIANKPDRGTRAQTSQTPGPRSKKYLGRYQILANDPLQIDAKFNGVPFQFNKTLTTRNENWLDELSLTVKNVSSKPIVYFSLELSFPETKAAGGILMAYTLRYGGDPKVAQHPIKEAPLESGEK